MVVGDLSEATEVAVVGAGTGGYVSAIRLAQLGKEVALISQDPLPGGECLHRGCIPSKALIEVGNLLKRIENAKSFGIEAEKVSLNFTRVQEWKVGVIAQLAKGVQQLLKQHGVAYHFGKAKMLGPHELEIQTVEGPRRLRFEQAVLATGSYPAPLPGLEFDGDRVLSSEQALSLSEVPERLVVIGGGYIGLELGQAYAHFGSRVAVVEATEDLLPGIDPELKRPLKKKLGSQGIEVHLNTRFLSLDKSSGTVRAEGPDGKNLELKADRLLVAVGRKPRSAGWGLENTGVALDERGFVRIDAACRTNVPHLYAIGDLAGGMMLAHKAFREGAVAAANIAGHKEAFDNQVPAVIFTDPEIAYVGLFESQAKAMGIATSHGLFSLAVNGRALTLNEPEGFIKVVAEKSTGRVLGVQMTGPHVSDLISEATVAIEMGATAEDLALTIHPHPTLSEAMHEAAEGVLGMSIHRFQKKANPDK